VCVAVATIALADRRDRVITVASKSVVRDDRATASLVPSIARGH